jgi:predicted enzyme related to lactoylglutathione lyase
MYISVVTLWVKDVDRAIDFYTKKLGWEKTMDEPMGDDGRWVTVAPRGSQTSLSLMDGEPEKVGGFTGIVIEVDDVFAAHKELSGNGIEFESEPSLMPWGGWAQFKDSEGNRLGLHSGAPANVSAN